MSKGEYIPLMTTLTRDAPMLFERYLRETGLWRQPDTVRDVLRNAFMAGLKVAAERGDAQRG